MRRLFLLFLLIGVLVPSFAESPTLPVPPSVLVLYDGPDIDKNPGRLDAMYLINLLGHFTTRRQVHPLESYELGEWQKYDAVFAIVYQKRYQVPALFLEDIAQDSKTFCWLGNQV